MRQQRSIKLAAFVRCSLVGKRRLVMLVSTPSIYAAQVSYPLPPWSSSEEIRRDPFDNGSLFPAWIPVLYFDCCVRIHRTARQSYRDYSTWQATTHLKALSSSPQRQISNMARYDTGYCLQSSTH